MKQFGEYSAGVSRSSKLSLRGGGFFGGGTNSAPAVSAGTPKLAQSPLVWGPGFSRQDARQKKGSRSP
jgi:hypothetical protein